MVFVLMAKKQRPGPNSELFNPTDWNLLSDLKDMLGMRVPRERAARMKIPIGLLPEFLKGGETFSRTIQSAEADRAVLLIYHLLSPQKGPVFYTD